MASKLTNMSRHYKQQLSVYPFVGFLCLLGGALVATMPYSVESFQLFESSMPTAAFTKRDAVPTITQARTSSNIFHNHRSSIVAPALVSTSSTFLSAHYLTTALEGLWEDRIAYGGRDETDDYQCLSWIDLDSGSNDEDDHQDQPKSSSVTLPLYPLGEVYLPMSATAIVNHTLNNVEPQNVKMALDLLSETSPSPRFCVVLRAMDTGRIASVGNIFRIVDADVQKGENDKIIRIGLTCQSEGLVEILEVENGSGWGEKRLLRSDEYLRAVVRPVLEDDDQEINDIDGKRDWQYAYNSIREDLRTIKLIYQLQLGKEDYPIDTLSRLGNAIQDFPELNATGVVTEDGADALLWNLAQEWQSVCMTLRSGRQALLATERNERMVAAACAGGGPLKLPIHLSDLDAESRREIQNLDEEFQEDHEDFGMDPILDFQVLIGLPTTHRRFAFLATLVARERLRLQDIASLSSLRR
jgi:hypothetical protein